MAYSANQKPSELNTLTSLATDDTIIVGDTSDADEVVKTITWANIKALLKTYFDTLYQAALVSGTNIKTINSTSLLGSGDIEITGGSFTVATSTEINTGADNEKGLTPLGINESVYRRIYQGPSEPTSPEDGDLWVDTSNAVPFYNAELNVIHQGQHTQYLDGVSASEIFRYILPAGQKLVLTGIEVLERGGGSQNDNFTLQVYDVTNAAQLAICSLNQSSTLAVTTDAAITYSLRVTNGAGTDKDACYAIRGYYIYGS